MLSLVLLRSSENFARNLEFHYWIAHYEDDFSTMDLSLEYSDIGHIFADLVPQL